MVAKNGDRMGVSSRRSCRRFSVPKLAVIVSVSYLNSVPAFGQTAGNFIPLSDHQAELLRAPIGPFSGSEGLSQGQLMNGQAPIEMAERARRARNSNVFNGNAWYYDARKASEAGNPLGDVLLANAEEMAIGSRLELNSALKKLKRAKANGFGNDIDERIRILETRISQLSSAQARLASAPNQAARFAILTEPCLQPVGGHSVVIKAHSELLNSSANSRTSIVNRQNLVRAVEVASEGMAFANRASLLSGDLPTSECKVAVAEFVGNVSDLIKRDATSSVNPIQFDMRMALQVALTEAASRFYRYTCDADMGANAEAVQECRNLQRTNAAIAALKLPPQTAVAGSTIQRTSPVASAKGRRQPSAAVTVRGAPSARQIRDAIIYERLEGTTNRGFQIGMASRSADYNSGTFSVNVMGLMTETTQYDVQEVSCWAAKPNGYRCRFTLNETSSLGQTNSATMTHGLIFTNGVWRSPSFQDALVTKSREALASSGNAQQQTCTVEGFGTLEGPKQVCR